nr:hypothetical protein [Tanacetum cinerariifolium]
MCDMVGQYIQKKEEEKQIEEEQAAKTRYWRIPVCYDDDDDEDYTIAITPKEPDNSLSMGDKHLDTIPSFYDEDIPKEIYLNPLFDKEIISMKIDPHHFNVESDLIESLLNHDSPIISSSLKLILFSMSSSVNSLFSNQFRRELMKLIVILRKKLVLSRDCYDYDSERDILILEELLSNDSLSLPDNESFHFDIPSSFLPPTKPPYGNTRILNVKVMGDISEHKVPMPRLMITQPTLIPNQEKSPGLLSHQGHEAFQPSNECPMMIYGKNTPILDVPFFHFYPP